MVNLIKIILPLVLLLSVPLWGQTSEVEDDLFDDDVIEAGEIEIIVEPELPTVIVTPIRQEPVIPEETLNPPLGEMVNNRVMSVKPAISKIEITPIEKPGKLLAKKR